MRRFLISLILIVICQFIFINPGVSGEINKINFKGNDFILYNISPNNSNYDMINRFFAEGIEQDASRDELVLFYSKQSFPKISDFKDLRNDYSKIYKMGRTFSDDNKYVMSFWSNSKNSKIYSILKFQRNTDIAGFTTIQLYLNIPNINNQNIKDTVKNLDAKYFDYFAKYEFPPLVDEYGNIFPKKHTITILNETYTMRFCRYNAKTKMGNNTFTDENNNLVTYKNIVRVNYIPNGVTPKILINKIIDDSGKNEGFKVITNESISKDEHIFSYVENIKHLKTGKEFKEYSIMKIKSCKDDTRVIQISSRISYKNETDANNAIKIMNTKFINYLKRNALPDLIHDNFGEQPTFSEQEYFNYYIGVK